MELIAEISRISRAREYLAFQKHIQPPFKGDYEGPLFRIISFFVRWLCLNGRSSLCP